MATYVMLTTLGPDGWETVRKNPDRILAVREEVEALGLTVKAQYGLMGQYDFLNIIEAPDEQTMAKAAIMLRRGARCARRRCRRSRSTI